MNLTRSGLSTLDQLYRSILLTKFFTHGWGKPENLRKLLKYRKILIESSNSSPALFLQHKDRPTAFVVDKERSDGDLRIVDGHFESPFAVLFPDLVEEPVNTAAFQMVLPRQSKHKLRPMCIHLAGTGDHYFWRRRLFMAKPLAAAGVASILLENPYYGSRKPRNQLRSSLRNVTDLFVMGGSLMLECSALLKWCEENGYGPLALHGISMGGHTDAFRCGQHFGQNLPHSISTLEELHKESSTSSTRSGSGRTNIPNFNSVSEILSRKKATDSDVMEFMQGVMDEFTHLGNYSKPVDASLVIVVAAGKDAYVPRQGVVGISELWPEAEVRYIPHSGHVQAALFYQNHFRQAILDALEKTACKYYTGLEFSL